MRYGRLALRFRGLFGSSFFVLILYVSMCFAAVPLVLKLCLFSGVWITLLLKVTGESGIRAIL
jgi:hypothetical protein